MFYWQIFCKANTVKLYGNDHKASWPWVGDLQAHISLGKLSSELLFSATEEQGNDKKGGKTFHAAPTLADCYQNGKDL
jgi:hypothetical protein